MLGWFIALGVALALAGYGAHRATVRRQRRQRRRARRARRMVYQTLWDQVFGRSRTKRLTVRREW